MEGGGFIRHRRASVRLVRLAVAGALSLAAGKAGTTTYGADELRTGWYPDEPSLTQSLVTGLAFGQQWSAAVTGQVYAQPLVSNGVLFVATEDNFRYGLDPDTGAARWTRQVVPPWNASDIGCTDLAPHVGITGTPVIDDAAGTAWFVSKTYASGTSGAAALFMHAVDITTGSERTGFPVRIQGNAQNQAAISFDPFRQHQRPGLRQHWRR